MDQSFVHSALELTAPAALLEEALTRESPDELLALLYRQMRALAGPRQDLDDLVQAAAERALKALERMAVLGPVRLGRDLTYPEFDFVRGDPRLKVLRKKVGLPD